MKFDTTIFPIDVSSLCGNKALSYISRQPVSQPRQHSDDKTIREHRERPADGRHIPHHAVRDALPDELQQRPVDAPQEVQTHRRHGAAEDPARLHRHLLQQPATRRLHRQPELVHVQRHLCSLSV